VQVGSMEVVPVLDGSSRPPLDEIVARHDTKEWDCPAHPLDKDGNLVLDLGSFLVRGRDRVVLVDAGVGSVHKDGWTTGELPESLRRLGVAFDDVTDVVFTHLHWDHVGWATQQGRVMFANATYRVHVADWAHFVTGSQAVPGAVKKLSPLEPRLEVFDEEREIVPGVIARPAPGHTPGSTIFLIADGGERALLQGDVAHTVAELTDPEWYSLYDLDPAAARSVRDRIASEAAESGDAIATAHFPGLRFGRLISAAGRRHFEYL
jgi:glyoxylase-like metal-dependent hydrolase (beta-lactamase superfamily II)